MLYFKIFSNLTLQFSTVLSSWIITPYSVQSTDVSEKHTAFIFRVKNKFCLSLPFCSAYSSTLKMEVIYSSETSLKMEVIYSSETSAHFERTTRRNIPEVAVVRDSSRSPLHVIHLAHLELRHAMESHSNAEENEIAYLKLCDKQEVHSQ
jgi:hypothetical protein